MKKPTRVKGQIGIVVSQFNKRITNNLLRSCLSELKKNGIKENQFKIVQVPGAYEIPFATQELTKKKNIKAVIGLGCIIKGQTSHDLHIANWVSTGLGWISLRTRKPVLFGVLTPNTERQGLIRSRPGPLNRGKEVARATLEMLHLTNGKG